MATADALMECSGARNAWSQPVNSGTAFATQTTRDLSCEGIAQRNESERWDE